MKDKSRVFLLLILDSILVNVSLLVAYLLRFDGQFANISPEYLNTLWKIAIVMTVVKLPVFCLFKLYASLWRYAGIYEMVSVLGAGLVSNGLFFTYTLADPYAAPRSVFLITLLTDIFMIGGLRFIYRIYRRVVKGQLFRFKGSKRIMVVGAGDAGAMVIKELKQHKGLKSYPVAIIDDDASKVGRKLNGIPVIGGTHDIAEAAKKRKIDEIIVAIPSAKRRVINRIYKECLKSHCKIKILPGVSQLISEAVAVKEIRDVNIEDLLGREPVRVDVEEIGYYLRRQVVLVTGGGGSIGSELCRQIAAFDPKKLIILDNYENTTYDIQNELIARYPDLELEAVIANIREKQRLENIFKKHKPAVVFHAAAHKHVPLMEANPTEALKNNVFGTQNVAECADRFGAKKFVLISTDKAVNPTNIMGATKRVAEMVIQAMNKHSKTEFVAVRFGNVLGSNGSVIPLFKKQIERGGPVTVTDPEVIRYFMTIPEAVQLVIQAGDMAEGGEIFVLDMGEPVRICDLARNLIRLSGFEPDEDIKIEFTGLRPGEKLYEELLLAEEGLQTTRNDKIFVAKPVFTDMALLRRELEILKDIMLNNTDGVIDYMTRIVPTYKKAQ